MALRRGDRGPEIRHLRTLLAAAGLEPTVDGGPGDDENFDDALHDAVRSFQQQRGLLVDGIVGVNTAEALREASHRLGSRIISYRARQPLSGDDVATLQRRLQELGFHSTRVDGVFGPNTHVALVTYQREYGLVADGICGPDTLRSLDYLGTRVTGGSPLAIREQELVRRSGPRLSGKRIVIDPARGGADAGLVVRDAAGNPLSEADILWDIAGRLEGRMAAMGIETFLSHARGTSPTERERAETANGFDADLMISLHCDASENPNASGVAAFHFGSTSVNTSLIGSRLSEYIQREIVHRTGMQDCRTHARTWNLLRLTRMPTVQVSLGYLTNAGDTAVLTEPRYRDVIAEAILVAIKRLYLLEDDLPTGTFTFAQLLEYERTLGHKPGP